MFPLKKACLFVLITFASCSVYGQKYIGKKKDIQKILKNIETFSKYYMAGDIANLVACYTEDGKIFPGNMDILEGKEGLDKYWTLPEGKKILHHKITPIEIKIVKKYAYDYGYYEGKTQAPDGKQYSWKGKYIIVWKKVGKDWKIYLDMWNKIPESVVISQKN